MRTTRAAELRRRQHESAAARELPATPDAPRPYCELVCVSVDYADYLVHTLPTWAPQFDRCVVVTSPTDQATAAAAAPWATVVRTDAIHQGGPFNKGRAINAGLAALTQRGWLLHVDADVACRQPLDVRPLDTTCLHGATRLSVPGLAAWRRVVSGETLGFPETDALAVTFSRGQYWPFGFFQLWHGPTNPGRRYPETFGDAGSSDVAFARQWPARQRVRLPLTVYHLEGAGDHKQRNFRANWRGRTTAVFE